MITSDNPQSMFFLVQPSSIILIMKFDEKNYRSESWGGSTVEDVLKYKDWIRDFREAVDAHKILQPEAEKFVTLMKTQGSYTLHN